MHDFFLAKEILDELAKIAGEKRLKKITEVSLEVGSIALAHDGMPEHLETINIENLEFGLRGLSKDTDFENTVFKIKKIEGENWQIVGMDVA